MKVLVTGISGMLGHRLAIEFINEGFEVFGTYYQRSLELKNCRTLHLDITSVEKVKEIVTQIQPEVVIHTAALTNVDYCEDNPEETYQVNVGGTGNLAQICKDKKIKLVYISTDFVFDGEKGFYSEEDLPCPLNVYAQTKLAGEKEVEKLEDFLIFRCTIYGWHLDEQKSIPEWVIENLEKKKKIKTFIDRIISPIYTGDFSKIIIEALRKNLSSIYHIACKEAVNIYHFAFKVAEVFNLDRNLIEGVRMDEVDLKARRPKNSSLSPKKIEDALEKRMPSLESGLRKMKEEKGLAESWLE